MKIQSIHEAFSQQPSAFYVGQDWYGEDRMRSDKVSAIVEATYYINGDPYPCFHLIGERGDILGEFIKGTVNVLYFSNPPQQGEKQTEG